MFIYTCIWFQITFSVTYNPLVWRAVMMPNVDNMLSIGYLGSYSFAGLKQDEINPEDQPPSSHDWEKKEWSIELGFFIHWQILKQNQEWEQWKFSSIFDFNKWNVTFCLYVFFVSFTFYAYSMMWWMSVHKIKYQNSGQQLKEKIFQIQFQWKFPDTDLY